MNKRNRIIYWIAMVWLALGMVATGIQQLMHLPIEEALAPPGTHGMAALGYPAYLLTIIGTWKLLGTVVLFLPRTPLLKEWAYAGFFFLLSGALFSHIAVGHGAAELFPAGLLLVMLALSVAAPAGQEVRAGHLIRRMNPKVDWFFAKDTKWQEAFQLLREIALDSGLTEELKWGHPCYTLKGKNVFLMHGFNDYCALLFHKGALLKDDHGILVQQTANVQSARQIRFTSLKQIKDMAPMIRSMMQEAIAIEQSGAKVPLKKTAEFDMPEEFAKALKQMPELKKAFNALTPGRQRGYLLHFASAKQAKTREARIEKHTDRILAGKGLDD